MDSRVVKVLRRTSPPRGFSLLETLVVVAVLGLVMALAGLSLFQAADRKLQTQVDRIQAVLNAVSDRAAVMQRAHRLVISAEGFWVEERRRGEWLQQLTFPMQFRSWESGLVFEGEPAYIRVDRTGLVEPSRINFKKADRSIVITVDPFAKLHLKTSEFR